MLPSCQLYDTRNDDDEDQSIACLDFHLALLDLLDKDMDGLLKDLSKLEAREAADAATLASVQASIDALERWRAALMADGDGGGGEREDDDDDDGAF